MYFRTWKFGIHGNKQMCLAIYTLLLKLKLVSHFLSNRNEIFTQATLIVLLEKSNFQFLISTLGVEVGLCASANTFNLISTHLNIDIKNWKPLFFSKTIKVTCVKISCLLDKKWLTSFNLSKRV